MKVKVSVGFDVVGVVFPGITIHACTQPPVPAAFPGPTLELDVPMEWPPGKLLGAHVVATRVRHRGGGVIGVGHDCGRGIAHITMLPLPDPMSPIHAAMSSRRVVFPVTSVLAEGKPLGGVSSDLRAPMIACATVPTPLVVNTTNAMASVDLGLSPADVHAGVWAQAEAALLASLEEGPGDAIEATAAKLVATAMPAAVGLALAPGPSGLRCVALAQREPNGSMKVDTPPTVRRVRSRSGTSISDAPAQPVALAGDEEPL